jgi:hypothetical protein
VTKAAVTNSADAPARTATVKAPAKAVIAISTVPAKIPAMTPAEAVVRHLEWLEFALAAAKAEESWRQGRLAKSTRKNHAKREDRLAEVVAEVIELTALLAGIRALNRRPGRKPATRSRRAGAGAAARSGAKTRTRKAAPSSDAT